MKPQTLLTALATLLLALALPAQAHWPTNRVENVAVAADPDHNENNPFAMRYPGGKTLVAFQLMTQPVFQIIDRYGDLVYPEPQSLWPAHQTWPATTGLIRMIPDSAGGALIFWGTTNPSTPQLGFYAQRLDSLGNLLWGDEAVWVSPLHNSSGGGWDICADGDGGLFLGITAGPSDNMHLRLQHISAQGQRLLGDSCLVVIAEPGGQSQPRLAPDGLGGVYIAWEDHRPPYGYTGAILAERFSAEGQPMWPLGGGVYVNTYDFTHKAFPDGQRGLLVMKCSSIGGNSISRLTPRGSILWTLNNVSYGLNACLVLGEPGYFYLGFYYDYDHRFYTQKMSLQGNILWPGQPGVLTVGQATYDGGGGNFQYYNHELYCVCNLSQSTVGFPKTFRAQIVNSQGQCRFSTMGIILTYYLYAANMYGKAPIPDGRGGLVGVFGYQYGDYNIYAKHMNADGSLGGPLPPTEENNLVVKPVTFEVRGLDFKSALYVLPQAMQVRLELYNLLGARVQTLQDGYLTAGTYTAQIDNHSLPSGIYFLRLQAGEEAMVKKMVMLK